MHELDKPVQAFLLDGGEFAVDWVDRLLDLLDRLREPAPDLDGVRLPEWVVEYVQQAVEDRAPVRSRSTAPVRTTDTVRLALDPYGLGVHLVLPSVDDQVGGTVTWEITLDGVTQVVRSRAMWPGATSVPATLVALASPSRTAVVSMARSGLTAEVDVVDAQDPLLVFNDDGRRLPAALPLPPELVWMLRPTETPVVYEGMPASEVAADPPYGWDGWSLHHVDLQGVTRLRLPGSPTRTVRGSSRARLDTGSPLAGVRTASGAAVFAVAPGLLLPASDVASGWSVIVRRPGQRPMVSMDLHTREGVRLDVFADVPRPLVGPYQVLVRGPLGRGLSRQIDIVEELRLVLDPPWREFATPGLVESDVRLSATDGVRLSPSAKHLTASEQGLQVQVSGVTGHLSLEVVPPHMAAEVAGRWSAGPLRLETERIGELADVAVRISSEFASAEVLLSNGNDVVQRTTTQARGGVLRLDLRRFADTLQQYGAGRLELELLGRRLPLAVVRPRRLAAAARLEADGHLQLEDAVSVEGLQAAAYAVHLPWRPPEVHSVERGTAGQLTRLRGAGRLLVHLRVDDPWLPAAWPLWPGHENTFVVEQPLEDAAGWEGSAAAWLRGAADVPSQVEAVPALLQLYGLHDELAAAGVSVSVRDGVARALSGDVAVALDAALSSTADAAVVTAALVHSGAVAAQIDLPPATTWNRHPVAAVTVSSRALQANDEEVREALRRSGGPLVDVLLTGEPDPQATTGRFGPEALRLAAMPPEFLDQVWRAANIVPASLLDGDARATAARQLFEARKRPGVQRVAQCAAAVSSRVQAELQARELTCLARAIGARTSAPGWQSLPALSLALALAARLASRGDEQLAALLAPHRPSWAGLARHAPDLVQIDLLLAECHVLGAGL